MALFVAWKVFPSLEVTMNKTIAAAVGAFVLGSITTGVFLAQAQQRPAPPEPPAAGGPPARGPWMGPGQATGPWADRMRERHAQRMQMMRVFALVDRAEDRKLTPPDVQKIAEAFLLWNGNHTWKVINVKPAGDDIAFDLAAPDGSVIASFTMNPTNAHVSRKG